MKRLPVHRNLVRVFQVRETERAFLTVMEKMESSLLQLVKERALEEVEMVCIVREVVQGLDFLHKRRWVHRDVKMENVLVGKNGEVKLCDFGFTIEEREIVGEVVGTGYARAPEIGKGKRYGRKVDLWGVGILLFVMKFRRVPFYEVDEVTGGVEDWAREDWGKTGDVVKGLLKGLLEKDPTTRWDTERTLVYTGGLGSGEDAKQVIKKRSERAMFKMMVERVVKTLRILDSLKANMQVSTVV